MVMEHLLKGGISTEEVLSFLGVYRAADFGWVVKLNILNQNQ